MRRAHLGGYATLRMTGSELQCDSVGMRVEKLVAAVIRLMGAAAILKADRPPQAVVAMRRLVAESKAFVKWADAIAR